MAASICERLLGKAHVSGLFEAIFGVESKPCLGVGGSAAQESRDRDKKGMLGDRCSEYRLQPGFAMARGKTRLKPVL